jgi:predicted transcriptional regulator
MPRPKLKTTTLTVRIEPAIKEALVVLARAERRSLASMLEVAVLEYRKNHPGKDALKRKPRAKST